MIESFIKDIANKMEVKLSGIVLADGNSLGCFDASLLSLMAGSKSVSEFVHKSELEDAKAGLFSNMLEFKIRSALTRLKILSIPL